MRIHHIALQTHDLGRLEKFYVTVLELRVLRRAAPPIGSVWLGEPAAASEPQGTVLMLERARPGEPPIPSGSMDLVAFAAPDDPAWKAPLRARVVEAGSTVEAETAHTLYFRDPDGRRIACSDHPLR